MWPLAGRAQGGAGYPAHAWRSGASLRPPRPCPRLRCGAAAGRHAVAGALWDASLRVSAGLPGWCVGWCRGRFLLSHFVSRRRRAAWASSALGAVVASAGRVRPGRWRLSLAAAAVGAVVLGGGGRGRLFLVCRRVGFRWRLVGLGRLPAGRAAVLRPLRACVRRLRAGGRAAVASAVAASGAARSGRVGAGRVGGWGFPLGAAALPPPLAGVSVTAPALPPATQTAAGLSPA